MVQGRAVHSGEQIRTAEVGASDRPRPLRVDCWGILNNGGEMRSHDCGARAALAPQRRARVRNPGRVGTNGIILQLQRRARQ